MIEGSQADGIRCTTSACTINTSQISRNRLIGIDATPTRLEVRRSSLTENLQGGVSSVGGTFEIVNNFVFRNGNDADGKFGGLRLDSTGSDNQVEHNTIVFNDSDPFANPALAGGLFCKGSSAPNNIIYNNFAGSNTMPNAQTAGTCNLGGSLIVNGNDTNEMHFVAPITMPFDYHLADALGPAVNAGLVGMVIDDFDGEPRTNGAPDIGADELSP